MPRLRKTPSEPTRYQELVSMVRRYDQTSLLAGLSEASTGWDGSIYDDAGNTKKFLPWNVLGVSAVVLCRGTQGGKTPSKEDVAWVCFLYSNLEHPGEDEEMYGIQMVSRIIYQQWLHQRPGEYSWARAAALYGETSFKPGFEPKIMKHGWDEELFGCSVREFLSVGFILYSAANQGSHYPFAWEKELSDLLADLGGTERFHEIAERNFFIDSQEVKEQRIAAVASLNLPPGQAFRREPFTFNPLVAKPFVGGVFPGKYFAPSASALQLRCSVSGIVHAGLKQWGNRFTDEAGLLFEEYIGRNLAELDGAQCLPEILYREEKQEKKSVDWIVITPTAVILIECKNSMPTAEIREGRKGWLNAHEARLGKAVSQINTTARLIYERKPEFCAVPANLPVIGLVTTLEPFETANAPEVRSRLPAASVPVGIAGADTIEFLATVSAEDQITLYANVMSFTAPENALQVNDWLASTAGSSEPILVPAFDNLPVIAYVKRLGLAE